MMKKLGRRVSRVASRLIDQTIQRRKKKKKQQQQQQPAPTQLPSVPLPAALQPAGSAMASYDDGYLGHHHHHRKTTPFVFPRTESTVLPDPSAFFSGNLLSSPLPTNSFFQNFVLKNGDQPEYIHPYLVRSSSASLSISYPSRFSTPAFLYQTFAEDLTISAAGAAGGPAAGRSTHLVSAFDGLSVTLDLPPALRFFLVRGSPYVTCATTTDLPVALSISTVHAILSVTSDPTHTRHAIHLNSGQTFLCYASSPLRLAQPSLSLLQTSEDFAGVLRFAYVPDPSYEPVLDRFSSSCYPVSGAATFAGHFCLEYRWEKRGFGDLLLLCHPLHLRLLSRDEGGVSAVLDDFKYNSIDGDLVGVVGDSWLLKADPIPVTWHSIGGVSEEGYPEIAAALCKDVDDLSSKPITTTSSYFYGKAVARAARLALIAEEVCLPEVIPAVQSFLESAITPWLDGSFTGNGFLYDPRWGGMVTKQGLVDSGADFGFGVYNDHHYHLDYFLYAIAVLSKLDPAWGRKYMLQAYSMVGDFMNPSSQRPAPEAANYTRLAVGATQPGEHQRGRQPVLLGSAPGTELRGHAARRRRSDTSGAGGPVGGWGSRCWFAPAEWRECWLGIQVLSLLPITMGQRALVCAGGVEGVPAGDPGAAIAAHHGGPVQGRRVREGAGEVGVAGAGEGGRRGRLEVIRVRDGGGLRGGGAPTFSLTLSASLFPARAGGF